MRLHVIACDIVARPVYLCAARSPHVVDVTLLQRGLHNEPPNLRSTPPGGDRRDGDPGTTPSCWATGCAAVRRPGSRPATCRSSCRAPTTASPCSSARASATRPRPAARPPTGTWPTSWSAATGYGTGIGDFAIGADTDAEMEAIRAEYVAKYGEDNADYLMEVLGALAGPLRARPPSCRWASPTRRPREAVAREQAERRGWAFERVEGSMVLLRRLIDGDWDDDMLVAAARRAPGDELRRRRREGGAGRPAAGG